MSSKAKKIIIALLGFILIVGVAFYYKAGQNQKQESQTSNNEIIEEAKTYAYAKEYDQAIEKYLEAIEIQPDNEDLYNEVIDLYYKSEQFDKELDFITSTMEKFKDDDSLQDKYTIVEAVKKITENNDTVNFGKDGSLYWSIDGNGLLEVAGIGDYTGTDDMPDWISYKDNIINAKFTISEIKNCSYLLYNCTNLQSIDLTHLDTRLVTDMGALFNGCEKLSSLDVSGFDTSQVESMVGMFQGCMSIDYLDLHYFDTSSVTNMSNMFEDCTSLKSIDLTNLDTTKLKDMSSMFFNCTSLQQVDLSSFYTESVNDMSNMFYHCSSITSLDLSSFSTVKVTSMNNMFNGCTSLKSVNVSNFSISNTEYLTGMFNGCSSLESVDLSSFKDNKVSVCAEMFKDCTSLKTVDLSNFEENVDIIMNGMFYNCQNLEKVSMTINVRRCYQTENMFDGCNKLDTSSITYLNKES